MLYKSHSSSNPARSTLSPRRVTFITRTQFSDNEYVQWLHLDFQTLGYELMLGAVYIPPPDSPYCSGDEFEQIMSDIIDIGTKRPSCKICLIGDFNATTGNLPNFVEAEKHLLSATGLDDCDTNLFIDRNMFERINISVDRYTSDQVVDINGKKLLDLCSSTCMLIVNGRTGKEKSGGATCKGVSTIDYAIASADLLQHVNDFHIDIFDRCLSDVHSPLSLELNSLQHTNIPKIDISQKGPIRQHTTQLNPGKPKLKNTMGPHQAKCIH